MSGNAKIWLVILLLPFLAAIGYDFNANYFSTPEQKAKLEALQIDPEAYHISDLGYIFLTHAPDEYHLARESIAPETWNAWIDPVLQTETFVVALAPFAVFCVWLLIARIFSLWPFAGSPLISRKSGDKLDRVQNAAAFKFKRK